MGLFGEPPALAGGGVGVTGTMTADQMTGTAARMKMFMSAVRAGLFFFRPSPAKPGEGDQTPTIHTTLPAGCHQKSGHCSAAKAPDCFHFTS